MPSTPESPEGSLRQGSARASASTTRSSCASHATVNRILDAGRSASRTGFDVRAHPKQKCSWRHPSGVTTSRTITIPWHRGHGCPGVSLSAGSRASGGRGLRTGCSRFTGKGFRIGRPRFAIIPPESGERLKEIRTRLNLSIGQPVIPGLALHTRSAQRATERPRPDQRGRTPSAETLLRVKDDLASSIHR